MTYLSINRPIPFMIAFFISMIVSLWIDKFVFPDTAVSVVYLFPVITAGVAFWRFISIQLLVAGFITGIRYYIEPSMFPNYGTVISAWLLYSLSILAVSVFIRLFQAEKMNKLHVIHVLAKSLDSRDPYTASHSENVAKYAIRIAKEIKLSRNQCHNIYAGGLLHDIGKIGIPESILAKPTKLTNDEYEIVKRHPVIGYEMVKHIPIFRKNGVLDMILYHHERFDGKGYPEGLRGVQIPLAARILAVADSFDAMTSRRSYRKRNDLTHAMNEIDEGKGAQFDPEIVDIFLKVIAEEGMELLVVNDSNLLSKKQ